MHTHPFTVTIAPAVAVTVMRTQEATTPLRANLSAIHERASPKRSSNSAAAAAAAARLLIVFLHTQFSVYRINYHFSHS